MLRTMRQKTKVIMLVLVVAFVGWLVFDVGMGITGQGEYQSSQNVGSVNGEPIRYQEWLEASRQAFDQERQRNPGGALSREDQRAVEDAAFEQLIETRLMRAEVRRRRISVSDRELADAVRRSPPPEVVNSAEFQTDGRFDPEKWARFLASPAATVDVLQSLEQRYRDELPRVRLLRQVSADVYVSDPKLWTIYRDQHDSVTVRALVIRPGQAVADASVRISDQDLEASYRSHQTELRIPARAHLSFVAVIKLPTVVDSVAAMARARALRDSLLRGADFAAIARTESADTASREQGGELPMFGRGEMAPAFEQAAFRLPLNRISEPVVTSYGVHLITVERRTADSVKARHILISFARSGARLDTLEARADSLERIGAEQTSGTVLDSVARLMALSLEQAPVLYQGRRLQLGRFVIPDVGVWAFEAKPGETSPVIETRGAYYVFRLDSAAAAAVPPRAEVEPQLRLAVMREKKRAAAEAIARDAERRLASGQSLDQVAEALRIPIARLGPFTRTSTVPVLGTASAAVGTAFRLRVGERSGMLSGDEGFFFIEPERRIHADSAAFEAQKEDQRVQVIRVARRLRVQSYVESLRRQARVENRLDQLRTAPGQP